MDAKEERRKRDRERYERMTDEEKREKLKKRREAYQRNKPIKERKKYEELEPEQRTKICAQERQRYANKESKQKKARIEQITANKVLKRNTPSKDSIAMVNPAYIATEEKVCASTLNVRKRAPVTPGERQALLHRQNEQRKTASISSQEEISIVNTDNNDIEPTKQPQVMIKGKHIFFTKYIQ